MFPPVLRFAGPKPWRRRVSVREPTIKERSWSARGPGIDKSLRQTTEVRSWLVRDPGTTSRPEGQRKNGPPGRATMERRRSAAPAPSMGELRGPRMLTAPKVYLDIVSVGRNNDIYDDRKLVVIGNMLGF
ncbi:hypothetical protein BC937DRAFT_92859 [Endogone sp. FLAS-F59071]|nr:hypothetical protein BC937DRAFT_92859 [Endogone sp. FLAS-F59071]|eukprot:RUS15132.1 hypothetical protein BC937DRAFT_92859 [Endogone sp. FLAS-F59071]